MTLIEIVGTNATLAHQYIIMSMIGVSITVLLFIIFGSMRLLRKKNIEIKQMQQQQIAKIDSLRIEHNDMVGKLRGDPAYT